MAVFGVFFEKKGVKLAPLSWRLTCWRPVHVSARLSFPFAPAFPLSPTGSAPDIPYAPLRLRPLARRCGGPGGSQLGQGKSDLPWRSVNAHLTLTGRARRCIGPIGRAARPTNNPGFRWQQCAWMLDLRDPDVQRIRHEEAQRQSTLFHSSFKGY
jgi:hypothetical protein